MSVDCDTTRKGKKLGTLSLSEAKPLRGEGGFMKFHKNLARSILITAGAIFLTAGIVRAQCVVESFFSPYDNVEKVIVKRLSEAKESIQCSLYGVTNRKITDTLKKKIGAGVEVTLCLDKTQSAGKSSTHKELEEAGADVVIKKTGVLEYNKFCIIDNGRVVM